MVVMDFITDDNNNTSASSKSYSLRPRTTNKKERDEIEEEDTWRPRNRSRKRQKQKSAPLSKYRRKTANARERSRMREINDAFETLRKAVPHLASECDNSSEKISKIMTLRLAMKYITALSNALEEPESFSLDLQMNLLMDSSSTSSSLSDHVPLRDQFVPSTLPIEPTFSVYNPILSPVRSDSFSRAYFDSSSLSLTPTSQPENCPQSNFADFFTDRPSETILRSALFKPLLNPPQDSRPPELSRHTLTPPDETSTRLPFESFHQNSSSITADFQNSSNFFSTDFDGLPSPVMDFCDLFIS